MKQMERQPHVEYQKRENMSQLAKAYRTKLLSET